MANVGVLASQLQVIFALIKLHCIPIDAEYFVLTLIHKFEWELRQERFITVQYHRRALRVSL